MKIRSARFVVSNSEAGSCPDTRLPEYAFIGRSNVGKSSLINMLTGQGSLAKTSGTPGKTQLINHFLINEEWYLVDLPGYGYAKVSKTERAKFRRLIEDYFHSRPNLLSAFVLVDLRHDPQKADLEFMEWLHSEGIPFSIVFTKADKLKPGAVEQNAEAYLRVLTGTQWLEAPHHLITSAANRRGREEVLWYIEGINREYRRFLESGQDS